MARRSMWTFGALAVIVGASAAARVAEDSGQDFGKLVEQQLAARAPHLFGIVGPLDESALGPFAGLDSADAVVTARNLQVSVISTATAPTADMIAMWPDDENPTHLFVCVEAGGTPSVQRVDLAGPPNANATTILNGLSACDPIRRTPWGTIVAAEEAGATGGLYEILHPASLMAPVQVIDRATGLTSDPSRVVKRKAVGGLSWEGNAILPDGTMYMGDELRPGAGNPGGGIYKFVPDFPHHGGDITDLSASPFASGRLYGLRVGSAGDFGQGSEIGDGRWVEVNPATFADANGNVILRSAQLALKFTGYYRPEDMDLDPIASARGEVRACWTNTGRMTNGGGSVVETGAIFGEVMCLTDTPDAALPAGAVPSVTRIIAGDHQANFFDNVAFQPHTGNLVVLEDGEVEVVKADGTTELRGNDLWICLPDGADRDVQSDGCVRFMSLRDTDSEPTGFIFTASGDTAYVNLQHRSTNQGALLRISGFRVPRDRDRD